MNHEQPESVEPAPPSRSDTFYSWLAELEDEIDSEAGTILALNPENAALMKHADEVYQKEALERLGIQTDLEQTWIPPQVKEDGLGSDL